MKGPSVQSTLTGRKIPAAGPPPAHEEHVRLPSGHDVLFVIGEFWTSRQRQASSLHEISYRACFKPQLPRFFVDRYTQLGGRVYDPFSGRGTTALEAALAGRATLSNDANPLSRILVEPRLNPPRLGAVEEHLHRIRFDAKAEPDLDLSMFYDPRTAAEIVSLREHLRQRRKEGSEDDVDRWIRMVATNRLTGHSPGFFSVYSLPPNQAASPESQRRINQRLAQKPTYRDTRKIILRKSRQLLGDVTEAVRRTLDLSAGHHEFLTTDAAETPSIRSGSVDLVVTSPPFLDVVQYVQDNWLRCWFNDIDAETVARRITMSRTVEAWEAYMGKVFHELRRVLAPGGVVAFEVGEVRKGKVRLEEHVVPAAARAGLVTDRVFINSQTFTKTSNIWGISNNQRGTNTNRIILLRRPDG